MSFTYGGYSSVFGDTGSANPLPTVGSVSVEVGEINVADIIEALAVGYMPLPSNIVDYPGGDVESVDTEPTPVLVLPPLDPLDSASTELPPVDFGPLGSGSGGTVAAAPPVEIPLDTPLEEIPEEIIFEGAIPEVLLGDAGHIDPYEPPTIVPTGFGDVSDGDSDMAIDWGDVLGSALGTVASGLTNPNGNVGVLGPIPGANQPPAKVTVDTRTGRVTACRRRRRKRLLTPTDLADLASLQTLVGKGSDAMKFAVTKAVRR